MDVRYYLEYQLGPNQVSNYLFAILIFLLAYLVLRFIKYVVIGRLHNLAKKTKTDLDDVIIEAIGSIGWLFYFIVSLFIGVQFVIVPDLIYSIIQWAFLVLGLFYAVKFIQTMITYSTKHAIEKKGEKVDASALRFISTFAKIALWAIAFILFLENVGVNISPLIAGLGIGGIAIAFALQGILSDLFASVSIALDKPFEIGDFVVLGQDSGTIEKIGLKSTRIRTLQGEEMVVSNQELTNTRVNNFRKMKTRRVVFQLGVVYGTKPAKLKKIPTIIKGIIKKTEHATPDRCHFAKFGDFSLNFETVYYIDTRDYNVYMDVQEKINLAIAEAFAKEKIEFAFPTQTVLVGKA